MFTKGVKLKEPTLPSRVCIISTTNLPQREKSTYASRGSSVLIERQFVELLDWTLCLRYISCVIVFDFADEEFNSFFGYEEPCGHGESMSWPGCTHLRVVGRSSAGFHKLQEKQQMDSWWRL